MAVNLAAPEVLLAVPGIRLASAYAAIRKQQKDDLALIEIIPGSSVAATFTRNKFSAAPVQLAKQHLQKTIPRYLLINAGNANAGTGDSGYQDALESCRLVAQQCQVEEQSVLPFSTGVIAQRLDTDKIAAVIPELHTKLDAEQWLAASQAIMTTDTVAKAISSTLSLQGNTYTVTGISKGSGMIYPNMATMLAYIATDLPVEQSQLERIHTTLVNKSFNAITIDGDTSTNDACLLISTQQGLPLSVQITDEELISLLLPVYEHLAKAIVRDGEGATKFVTIDVIGAASDVDAQSVAYTVAHSPLVKTALFASDANWGRILAAVGRAPVEQLDIDKIDLALNQVSLLQQGQPDKNYSEALGAAEMAKAEITISINLNLSNGKSKIWTSDLSHDYVSINADYRS